MAPPDGIEVVGIAGSRRAGSHTKQALTYALESAASAGAETTMLDLRTLDLEPFAPDEVPSDAARDLTETMRRGDAVILATPMYHGSYSSTIKTAIDYCGFDEFEHTTVGLLAVAGGRFPLNALEHLRSICRALDAWVLPYQAAVPRSNANFEDGALVDEELRDRVERLGSELVRYAVIQGIDPASMESQENVGGD